MQSNQHLEPARADGGDTRVLSSLEQLIQERIDRGVQDLREQAAGLMREIAAEMWREGGGDTRDAQERILSFISRDQSVRSLIAHSDERYQALAVRTGRLEDTLALLSQATKATQDAVRRGVDALQGASEAMSVQGFDELKARLAEVERHLTLAKEQLDARDRALIEAMQGQIEESGKLIHHETGRIVEALEGYVQGGLDVMGKMAQRVQEQNEDLSARSEEIEAKIARVVEEAAEQLGSKETIRVLESRLYGIARLIRADSEALRGEIDRVAGERNEALRHELHALTDDHTEMLRRELVQRIDGVADQVATTTQQTMAAFGAQLDTTVERVTTDLDLATQRMSERLDATAERLGERLEALDRIDIGAEVAARIDAAVGHLESGLDERIASVAATVGHIESGLDQRMASVAAAVGHLESGLDQRLASAAATFERLESAVDERLAHTIETRLAGLARLIRADNEAMAAKIEQAAEQEAAKQALRAVKELQSTMPEQLRIDLDRRFTSFGERLHRDTQATVEAVAKATDSLGRRVDQAISTVSRGQQQELQTVMERMGDAMHALASVGRPTADGPRPSRIELE